MIQVSHLDLFLLLEGDPGGHSAQQLLQALGAWRHVELRHRQSVSSNQMLYESCAGLGYAGSLRQHS